MKKIKSVLITGRFQKQAAVKTAKKVVEFLWEKKVLVQVDKEFPIEKKTVELKNARADLVLCFGGDGSLLDTFARLSKKIPVLGVNCGFRGTLCGLTRENVIEKLPQVLSGDFKVEERSRLDVFVDGKKVGQALNEVLVVSHRPGRILKSHAIVDGVDLGFEADDGVVIATPTGSTAHALSGGGPKIVYNAQVFVIVRLNPIDLNRRPLVVNDHSKIKITQIENTPVGVILDGQRHFSAKKEIKTVKGQSVLLAKA